MATETNQSQPSNSSILIGLSTVGGLGITLIMLALGFGVAGGETANSNLVGIAILTGVFLLGFAIVGWFGYVQPHKHFDDIDQAIDTGHHSHSHDTHTDTPEQGAAHH